LGNDSTLSLSTTAASIAGTLAVTGNATFDTNTLFVDAAANEVGIGTATPSSPLDVVANNTTAIHLRLRGRASDSVGQMELWNNAQDTRYAYFAADSTAVGISTTQAIPLTFGTNTSEKMRITSAGNVGIGTSSPATQLDVRTTSTTNAVIGTFFNTSSANNTTKAASISLALADTGGDIKDTAYLRGFTDNANVTSGGLAIDVRKVDGVPTEIARFTKDGLTFNGDTAAANALDDYEEGTFTATLVPSTSGSITLDSSYQTGVYTKIGRQVTVRGFLAVQSVASPVGGEIFLRGLPFTTNGGGGAAVSFFDAPTYAGSNLVAVVVTATTQINIVQSAALVSNGEEYYFTATYFV
jgi:hypothetical protein